MKYEWKDYTEESIQTHFSCELLLDIWFSDGSHGTYVGCSNTKLDKNGKLFFPMESYNEYSKNGRVKHYMEFPIYESEGCCWCLPYLNGDLYLKNGEVEFQYITTNYCPSCGKKLD
jgi:hypothetical protein